TSSNPGSTHAPPEGYARGVPLRPGRRGYAGAAAAVPGEGDHSPPRASATACSGWSARRRPGTGCPAGSTGRQPPRLTTGTPPRRIASATSERVPQEPPTAITASADCTMIALRAWPWLVTTATDRSGLAPERSGPGRMPTTSPPAARAPAATAAITPLPPPHSTTAPRPASSSPTRRAHAASVALHRAGPHTATCTGRVYAGGVLFSRPRPE